MLEKKILNPERIRRIDGGFSFIPHRASDRNGLSYYSYDRICTLLQFNLDEYIAARDGLIEKDLIAFDGSLFQVLSFPLKPVAV